MKFADVELTEDQGKLFIALMMDTPVQATTPKGQVVTLRPIPHWNSLDWGFTMWFEGQQVGDEYSIENPDSFIRIFAKLRAA